MMNAEMLQFTITNLQFTNKCDRTCFINEAHGVIIIVTNYTMHLYSFLMIVVLTAS
uniref:Uncharacterized protein n=1 Tax=Anguilla anguilla TaxID=7936 RepID=A0A0E9Q9Q1_ANGAN